MFAISLFIIGIAIAGFGWKIHRGFVAFSGFIIGGLVGGIGGLIFYGGTGAILGFIFLGVVTAFLFSAFEKLAIGLVWGSLGAVFVAVFTTTRNYLYSGSTSQFNYIAILLGFFVASYLGWQFYKFGYIVITAFIGAFIVSAFAGSMMIPALIVVFILGIIVQYSQEGSHSSFVSTPSSKVIILDSGISQDNLDKLKKLKNMYDSGLLTDAEYNSEKEKLLK